MKKTKYALLVAVMAFSGVATAALNHNNPPVDITGDVGTVNVSQCGFVGGNCNNPDMTINFNGDTESVVINGETTVIKGADGTNGEQLGQAC